MSGLHRHPHEADLRRLVRSDLLGPLGSCGDPKQDDDIAADIADRLARRMGYRPYLTHDQWLRRIRNRYTRKRKV